MDSIDDLLAQVKAEYDKPAVQQPQQKIQTEQFEQQQLQRRSAVDSLLAQVKADYEQQDEAEKLEIQQQLQAEEHRQQQLKQQKLEALNRKAIAWLKN